MSKSRNRYRKIKYFTDRDDALKFARSHYDPSMVASDYIPEEIDGNWVVSHYVLGMVVRTYVKNGILDY